MNTNELKLVRVNSGCSSMEYYTDHMGRKHGKCTTFYNGMMTELCTYKRNVVHGLVFSRTRNSEVYKYFIEGYEIFYERTYTEWEEIMQVYTEMDGGYRHKTKNSRDVLNSTCVCYISSWDRGMAGEDTHHRKILINSIC